MKRVLEPATLVVEGFLLRPPSTAEHRAALELGLDPDVRLWNPRCRITDEASAIEDCRAGADWSGGGHATFSIIERATDRYAGNIALHGIDADVATAKVGYRIAGWARGRGVASTVLDAVAAWAFAQSSLRRIELTHAVENAASCRVAQKGGFGLERLLPANKRFGDGRVHDEHLHARTHASPADGPLPH
ncbi:GNAT family N-acetyltransferase [Actinospica sp. MGRD01-02]|uniref:GNAT family N-acetyltransferase n=1 Tax=Actinospica acidithermotolerans TaxID=2828514 RepID=A0A941EHS3_9ACTN|nr:GNAT family protein [Actinospica acidithermotolerans]MBR7829344.1 GNAT family N-acetyltransferase [Actinospica acidithermotolerans]